MWFYVTGIPMACKRTLSLYVVGAQQQVSSSGPCIHIYMPSHMTEISLTLVFRKQTNCFHIYKNANKTGRTHSNVQVRINSNILYSDISLIWTRLLLMTLSGLANIWEKYFEGK